MTPDLYAVLDVPRSASRMAIRAAYRRASKETHPDMPEGSEKRFALVKLAHDTLTDDARRQRYDQTGETEEKTPDNAHSHALQCLAAALEAVLAECESARTPVASVDLVASMRKWISDHMREGTRQIDHFKAMIRENETLGRRFTGETMPQIISGRGAMIQARIDAIQHHQTSGENALKLLDDVACSFEPRPATTPRSFAEIMAGTQGLR